MEWVIVAVVLFVIIFLFGAKKIPDLARSLGRSSSEFKRGMGEGNSPSEDAETSDQPEKRE